MSDIVKVEFEIQLPDIDATDDEIEEWLRFELGDNGSMSGDNPLCHEDAEPIFGTFEWEER